MNITQALQSVAQIAQRCPTPTLTKAYLDTLRDFCGQSRWLRETITVTTAADDPDYDLVSADPDLEVIGIRRIVGATSAGKQFKLDPLAKELWPLNARSGRPRVHTYTPEASFALFPTPDAVYTMTVTAQMQPKQTATTLPDALESKWGRALVDGALGYLLDIQDQPWTNHGQADVRRRAFRSAINNAKADEQRDYNQGSVMVRQRAFITPRYW
jgi:hypothetical protein